MNLYKKYPEIFKDIAADIKANNEREFFVLLYRNVRMAYYDELYLFNIFYDRLDFEMTANILDIAKPELYITSYDCGVVLKGLLDIESIPLRNFFFDLIKLGCTKNVVNDSPIFYIKFIPEECKLSFIDLLNPTAKMNFFELDREDKNIVCDYMYKAIIFNSYYSLYLINTEEFKKCRNRYNTLNNDNIANLVEDIIGKDKAKVTKFMLINNINKDTALKEWNFVGRVNNFSRCKVSNLCYMYLTGNINYNSNSLMSFKLHTLGKKFKNGYRVELLKYFNEHMYDLIFVVFINMSTSVDSFFTTLINAKRLKVVEGKQEDYYDIILNK